MKKQKVRVLAIVIGVFVAAITATGILVSCDQSPIFSDISEMRPLVPPKIPGGPSKMVEFTWNSTPGYFVASGGLFWFYDTDGDGNSEWGGGLPPVPGRVTDVAATTNNLYITVMHGTNAEGTIYRLEPAGSTQPWKPMSVPGYGVVNSLFADGSTLYAGVRNSSRNAVFYIDDNAGTTLTEVNNGLGAEPGLLSGAVGGYISTRNIGSNGPTSEDGNGIFSVNGNSATAVTYSGTNTSVDRRIMGMIKLPSGDVIAINRSGVLFDVTAGYKEIPGTWKDGNGNQTSSNLVAGRPSTGALAVWTGTVGGNNQAQMLIAGVQGSVSSTTFNNGYVEFYLDPTSTPNYAIDTGKPPNPNPNSANGNVLVSVQGQDSQYRASLGRLPVNHFFQAPSPNDPNGRFFASTQVSGLWSFRERGGVLQWNAED